VASESTDDSSIAEAVEANDAFIDALRSICERARATLEAE
jgi:hypothetical protein